MGIKTDIEWCDSTLNLQMGCDGCELWNPKVGVRRCYAGKITTRMAGIGARPPKGWPESFDKPQIFPERLKEALHWSDLTGKDRADKPWLNGYPRTIFLNDMGDTFTESLDVFWLDRFIGPMCDSPHVYIILTKRPKRMAAYFWDRFSAGDSVPPNFFLMTSITGPENIGRIQELLRLREFGARVLGVSYEPAWASVDFRPWLSAEKAMVRRDGLDWLIAGGESGAGAKPSHPDWFRVARDACQAAGCAYFFKQWGEWFPAIQAHADQPDWSIRDPERIKVEPDGEVLVRVGKKAAGAVLDGREYREVPTPISEEVKPVRPKP